MTFQSTGPSRGPTPWASSLPAPAHFNPQAPRGARPSTAPTTPSTIDFNPQAPRGARPLYFLGGIHDDTNFNPQAPRGARHMTTIPDRTYGDGFQSTGPSRGPTEMPVACTIPSSHFNPQAPRGARPIQRQSAASPCNFNPQAPRGARHRCSPCHMPDRYFNPQAPRGARRIPEFLHEEGMDVFQSTGPSRGPTSSPTMAFTISRFQSTGPSRGPTEPRDPGTAG